MLFDPRTVLRSGAPTPPTEPSIDAARLLVAGGAVRRASATGKDAPVAAALVAAGHRDALAAPLVRDGRPIGALVSYDRTGHEGFEEGEEAVMAALAAVAARAIEKSELLGVIVEERRQLAEIVDRSSDGILTVGADGTVESWNPAMEADDRRDAPATSSAPPGMVQFAPRDADGKQVRFDRWHDDGIPAELLITTTSGERWLGCSSAVGGGGDTLVVVARDITRAREIDQMKDDFIATVSHELRTPLATIRGFTDVLEPPARVSDEMLSQVLGRIRKGTHRLERLVANLLEVSRIEARRTVDLVPAELDLVEVVRRVVDEVQESWPDRTIEVDLGGGVVAGPRQPAVARAHPHQPAVERAHLRRHGSGPAQGPGRGRRRGRGVGPRPRSRHPEARPGADLRAVRARRHRATRRPAPASASTSPGAWPRSMGAELDVRERARPGRRVHPPPPLPAAGRRPQLVDLVH